MMTAKMSDKDTREDIMKVFNLFDDDQTGHITLRNLKRVAKELGESMSGAGRGSSREEVTIESNRTILPALVSCSTAMHNIHHIISCIRISKVPS